MPQRRLLCLAPVMLAVLGFGGCAAYAPTDWSCPGPAPVQQGRAQQFDPYPQPGMGADVTGGRPRDYMTPVPEAARARWVLSGPQQR
jgi:hypothetical protein